LSTGSCVRGHLIQPETAQPWPAGCQRAANVSARWRPVRHDPCWCSCGDCARLSARSVDLGGSRLAVNRVHAPFRDALGGVGPTFGTLDMYRLPTTAGQRGETLFGMHPGSLHLPCPCGLCGPWHVRHPRERGADRCPSSPHRRTASRCAKRPKGPSSQRQSPTTDERGADFVWVRACRAGDRVRPATAARRVVVRAGGRLLVRP
jgi:hypothetical protein